MPLKKITPEQLMQKMQQKEQLVILDVRDKEKYNNFHIEGDNIQSLNIHKSKIFEMDKEISALPKGTEIIVTCTTGNSATKCATILSELNYDVAVLEGGLTAWKELNIGKKNNL